MKIFFIIYIFFSIYYTFESKPIFLNPIYIKASNQNLNHIITKNNNKNIFLHNKKIKRILEQEINDIEISNNTNITNTANTDNNTDQN